MWGWKPTFFEAILLIIFIIISSAVCFPCFLLQKMGFKAKMYSKFLWKTGLEQLSVFEVVMYKK